MRSLQNWGWAAAIGMFITALAASIIPAIVNASSSQTSQTSVESLIAQCSSRGRGSSSGGTTAAFSTVGSMVSMSCYDGRPAPNETVVQPAAIGPRYLSPNTNVQIAGIATKPPFAIFFGSDGSLGSAVWAIGGGKIADPTCSSSLIYSVTNQYFTETESLDCATGAVLSTPAPGPTL